MNKFYYTEEEIKAIDEYWGRVDRKELEKRINKVSPYKRNYNKICRKVKRMNEKACEEIYPAYGKFNEQAIQLLKTLEGKKIKTIQSELHKIRIYVSDQQVNKKMRKLGFFSYDDGNFSVEEIANLFNYSAMRIYQFIYLEKDNLPYEKVNKKKIQH